MNLNKLQQILGQAAARRFLVIGDLMLDEFVWGKVGRISPEAPVPVVEVTEESFHPGGAANVARNLRGFAKNVAVVGMFGKDASGQRLRDLLDKDGIDTSNTIESGGFRTIVKTRIIARHQQVVRVDREQISQPSRVQITKIVNAVRKKLPEVDAVIFEDYGKGFLVSELVSEITRAAHKAGKIVTADPNPRNPIAWKNLTAVKPNRAEAFLATGIPDRGGERSPKKDAELIRAGKTLLDKWGAQHVLVTLGEHGMMLFQNRKSPHHIPTKARDVYDVSGAGDTAIALFTLALTGGATPVEAAEIANHGSAVVVGKVGTETVSKKELIASFKAT